MIGQREPQYPIPILAQHHVLLQGLEVSLREGALLQEQLENTKRKLEATSANVGTMASSHIQTLRKLETAKNIIEGLDAASAASGSPRLSSRRGTRSPQKGNSRPGTSHSHREGEAGELLGSRMSPRKVGFQVHHEHGVGGSGGADILEFQGEGSPAASTAGEGAEEEWEEGLMPDEVAHLLEEQGLQREIFGKQRAWNQIKVSLKLPYYPCLTLTT